MEFNWAYLATIMNSTIRLMTPLLYASLAAAICSKAKIFNIAMEGVMMAGAFFSIVVNYYTKSVWLSVGAAVLSGVLLSAAIGFFVIKLKASPVIVGMAVNTMMAGLTSYLLFVIFNTKGKFEDPSLVSLPKLNLPVIQNIPFVSKVFGNLTAVDYMAFVFAVGIYIFLYKTVRGYRVRAVGINQEAARSLGTPVETYQFIVISLSGVLSGLGGVLLSMGSVTLFVQNITSGRGYIALAANNLGKSHPLGVLLSSLFFAATQALGTFLQNTSLKAQVTSSIPYVATIVALIVFSIQNKAAKKKRMKEAFTKSETTS